MHRKRLEWWCRQVESAREWHRALSVLCDYWQTIAEDVKEQGRFASETYHELSRIKGAD